jgi:reverse transcriptase-like protein
MKLSKENIEYIVTHFAKMTSQEEFIELLNYSKQIIIGENFKQFEVKQLTYYANPLVSGARYQQFKIKKKDGGIRIINAPIKELKLIQQCLNLILQCVFTPHNAATGFVGGKSIVDNAKAHINRHYVYNIDLKDFFSSIDQARVWKCFQLKPFNLDNQIRLTAERKEKTKFWSGVVFSDMSKAYPGDKDENIQKWTLLMKRYLDDISNQEFYKELKQLKVAFARLAYSEKKLTIVENISKWWNCIPIARTHIASSIAFLACTEMEVERFVNGQWEKVNKNVLPQGSPVSPVITNIVCQKLDFLLTGVAKRFNLKYTRYADDITFSSNKNVFKEGSDFLNELKRIIDDQNFHIKESKVRLQQTYYRQEVTGLIVNTGVNISRDYVKQIRMWLYYWECYGYDKAYTYFLPQYYKKRLKPVKGMPNMANVISGKLEYLKMVKGADNALFMKLQERFERLSSKHMTVSSILDIWEKHGMDKAMEVFYNFRQETA